MAKNRTMKVSAELGVKYSRGIVTEQQGAPEKMIKMTQEKHGRQFSPLSSWIFNRFKENQKAEFPQGHARRKCTARLQPRGLTSKVPGRFGGTLAASITQRYIYFSISRKTF